MNLKQLHSVHFLGIGGIGMSALARWFSHIGVKVSGYDRTPSPLTDKLIQEGMEIHFVDAVENIPVRVRENKEKTLIIWTPAIPKDSVEFKYLAAEGFEMKKRAVVLGMITSEFRAIAVAGTHGKTTTSSLIAHLLKFGGKNVAAFLGGISQNYNSNLILHNEDKSNATVVVEADEYDRSFLQLHPNIAVVTSADPDHLDVYGNDEEMVRSFNQFTDLISSDGQLYIHTHAFSKRKKSGYGKVEVRQ
jgi:UDP-N-acetylmuramate--alanine ligase